MEVYFKMIPFFSALLCLALPGLGLWRLQADRPLKSPWLLTAGSMACCGAAMLQELFTIKRRVFGGDVGGIQDTIDAVLVICIVLLVVSVLLNLLFLWFAFELAKEDAARSGGSAQKPAGAGSAGASLQNIAPTPPQFEDGLPNPAAYPQKGGHSAAHQGLRTMKGEYTG